MSALDTSVTLDDVFHVVNAKRVPVAAELAGYLALEIAESASAGHAGQATGEIDPRAVYIGEEGSVALVRPRRDVPAQETAGNAEASVRSILGRLLDASGSKTPALGQVAARAPGAGLPMLVEELENALIPVNRAAGRRALARLAREVKRVTQGVGRNAARPRDLDEPGRPSREANPLASVIPAPAPQPPAAARPVSPPAPARPHEPTPAPREVREVREVRERSASAHDPIADLLASTVPPHPLPPQVPQPGPDPLPMFPRASSAPDFSSLLESEPPPPVLPLARAPEEPARSGVDELLADFGVSGPREDEAMARELKALVGLDPTPPPATSAPAIAQLLSPPPHAPAGRPLPAPGPAASEIEDGGIEALLAETANLAPVGGGEKPVHLATQPAPATSAADAASARRPAKGAVPAREISRSLQQAPAPGPRTDRLLLSLALIIAVGGGAALWLYKPQLFAPKAPAPTATDSNGLPLATDPTDGDAGGAAIRPTREAACRGSLAITDAPEGAEVLIREGQAPLDVGSMPVGARLEFVATYDGYAPKRTVVPADAQWDKPDKPDKTADAGARFEVGVQLEPTKAKPGFVDPWPSSEPGTSVGGDGPPGVVHVASTPKGAEVWLLAGLGPATRIDQIRCDTDVDVLVAGPTTFRQRLHASVSDFASAPTTPGPGGTLVRTVTLSAKTTGDAKSP